MNAHAGRRLSQDGRQNDDKPRLLRALGRGLASLLSPRILILTLFPLILAPLLCAGLLWLGLQPLIDVIHVYFIDHDGYAMSARWLTYFGLADRKTTIVPLLAIWAALPVMIAIALILVGATSLPAIVRNVGKRDYPALLPHSGASVLAGCRSDGYAIVLFILLSILTAPLSALSLGFAIQPLLWAWLSNRVIVRKALADHADDRERRELSHAYRWPLLAIGAAAGLLACTPAVLFLGSTASIVLFPAFALISMCWYVLIFTFSGLWIVHYGLAALGADRMLRQKGSLEQG